MRHTESPAPLRDMRRWLTTLNVGPSSRHASEPAVFISCISAVQYGKFVSPMAASTPFAANTLHFRLISVRDLQTWTDYPIVWL